MSRLMLSACAFVSGLSAPRGAADQLNETTKVSSEVTRVSRPRVWRSNAEGNQVPLWPEGLALQRPESEKPEEVGNGSKLVAGRPWRYAAYVSRPTMTIYPPKTRNNHAAILVLPGGGYEALAMDLEGTEICDWVTKQGMTCVLLKYRVPQAWRHGENSAKKAPNVQLALQDAQRLPRDDPRGLRGLSGCGRHRPRHDLADDKAGHKIQAPLLALWGAKGTVSQLWDVLATWRPKADGPVVGKALPCGHLIPQEQPELVIFRFR